MDHPRDPGRGHPLARHDDRVKEREGVDVHRQRLAVGIGGLDDDGRLVEPLHRGDELRFEVGVGLGAGRLRRARREDRLERAGRGRPPLLGDLDVRRGQRVDDHAADALGVIAQLDQRQLRAVRGAVDVPFVDAQCHAQVGEVGGVLGRVVGRPVDAGRGEAIAARLDRGNLLRRLLVRGKRDADRAVEGVVVLGATEQRVGEMAAPLVEQDDVALGVQRRCPGTARTRTIHPRPARPKGPRWGRAWGSARGQGGAARRCGSCGRACCGSSGTVR